MGYMTTYKCNICDNEVFGKVSGLKRHQTRKHSGVSDLAIIEVLDDGTEHVLEAIAKQPAPRKKVTSRKRKPAPVSEAPKAEVSKVRRNYRSATDREFSYHRS